MPNIVIRIPKRVVPSSARKDLLREVTQAAATAERIPSHPKFRSTAWVMLEEIDEGMWMIGGVDPPPQVLPCMALVFVPQGVLDESLRAMYCELMHRAFVKVLAQGETRRVATSVILNEVQDGFWGASGARWRLADFAEAAGYEHLRHLVAHPGPVGIGADA